MVWWDQDKLIWFRWCQACVAASRWGVQRQLCLAYSQAWWECNGPGLHECCRHWGATVNWRNHECQHVLKQSMIPSLRRLGRRAVFQHNDDPKHTSKMTTALLKKPRVKVICGASSNGRWRSARSLTSTSSVMLSWRSGRGLQWKPVKLWWTLCPRRLRQCWKIMVATQNIYTLGPILSFSLRGVLTFVASGLDINGCVLSYFEGTANAHCYTSCTLNTLHCSKVQFLQCCHMKRYKIFTKMWGVYSLLWDTVYIEACVMLAEFSASAALIYEYMNT